MKHLLLEEEYELSRPVEHNREAWADNFGPHELVLGLDADEEPVIFKYGERAVITILGAPGSGKSVLGAQLAEQMALSKEGRGILYWDKQREISPTHREPISEELLHPFYKEMGFLPMGWSEMLALIPSIATSEEEAKGTDATVFPINLKQLREDILPELVADVWSSVFQVDADKSESYNMVSQDLLKSGISNPKQLLARELNYRQALAAQKQGTLISNVFSQRLRAMVEGGMFGRLKPESEDVLDAAVDLREYFNKTKGLPVIDLLMSSAVFSSDPNVFKWNAYCIFLSALIHSLTVKKQIVPPCTIVEEFEVGLSDSSRAVFSQQILKGARHGSSIIFSTQAPSQLNADVRKEILGFSNVILATNLRHADWLDELTKAGFLDARWIMDSLDVSSRPCEWVAFFQEDSRAARLKPLRPLSNFLKRRQA